MLFVQKSSQGGETSQRRHSCWMGKNKQSKPQVKWDVPSSPVLSIQQEQSGQSQTWRNLNVSSYSPTISFQSQSLLK